MTQASAFFIAVASRTASDQSWMKTTTTQTLRVRLVCLKAVTCLVLALPHEHLGIFACWLDALLSLGCLIIPAGKVLGSASFQIWAIVTVAWLLLCTPYSLRPCDGVYSGNHCTFLRARGGTPPFPQRIRSRIPPAQASFIISSNDKPLLAHLSQFMPSPS